MKAIKIARRPVHLTAVYVNAADGWLVEESDGSRSKYDWRSFVRLFRASGQVASRELELRAAHDGVSLDPDQDSFVEDK
jgi:hypothetical protein